MSAAAPSPTIPATFSEPDRRPLSWPPPCTCGQSRRRARRSPTRAPTPPGPQILWPLSETRSIPNSSISSRIRPTNCVASEWSRAPVPRTISEISPSGFITPVSALAAITDTNRTSGPRSDSSRPRSTNPPPVIGTMSSPTRPRSASHFAVRDTDACSAADIRILYRPGGVPSNVPRRARLLASVALAVKTTPFGEPPTKAATCSRASSTRAACRRPNA